MDKYYRLLDANVNRVSEGIRVLEDIARFCYDDAFLSEELKKLRHAVRKKLADSFYKCIDARDSYNDVGLCISRKLGNDNKNNTKELLIANFKRAQEGLRTIEETLKVMGLDSLSREFEVLRYGSYTLEKNFYMQTVKEDKRKKLDTDLYCITAEEHSMGRSNIEVVQSMIDAGIKIIQYREKDKTMLEKYGQCMKIREMTLDAGVTFIINDHIDLALSVGADGVHLGQDDIPIEKARMLVGEDMIIGLSTHSPKQAEDAVKRGADYIGVGPLFKTNTKKDVCDPVGLEYLEYAVRNVTIPFVAIGGIKLHNIGEVRKKGARCIALVTEIVGTKDIKGMIDNIREI